MQLRLSHLIACSLWISWRRAASRAANKAREHHQRQAVGRQFVQLLEAVHAGHPDVQEQQVRLPCGGESVIQAVVAGLGITQVPRMLAACMLEKGLLELVMTETKSTGKPVWIVYPQKMHLSARVQAFIDWVRELFERTNEAPAHLKRPFLVEAAVEVSAGLNAQPPVGSSSNRATPNAMR